MEQENLDVSVGDGAAIAVPSGQAVTLLDIIWNSIGPEGPAPRFRFVAPAIAKEGGSISYEVTEADLLDLCQSYVIGKLAEKGVAAPLVLVSIADRAVEFGVSDPEATQYFEAFTIDGSTCSREIF
jgi:hypothetical protein